MLETLLRSINERHGTAFVAGERYAEGEQGAYALREVRDGAVRRAVLKWEQGTEVPAQLRGAVAVTDQLRAVGYPTPRYLLIDVAPLLGVVYSVQEELPGTPLDNRLTQPVLDGLFELSDLQRGRAGAASRDWPGPVADPVLHGGDGFCLLDTLRSYSTATRELLGELQRMVREGMGERSPGDDVVHFDFTGANILADGDRITGVIDWAGWCVGDRAFDLATFLFYANEEIGETDGEQIDRLWRRLLGTTGPRLLGVYLAHMVLRQVDWSIRFHDRTAVDAWLRQAEKVLGRLRAEGARR